MKTLEETGGNRSRAADMLGIGLRTLQRKLKEYKGEESGSNSEEAVDGKDEGATEEN